MTSRSKIRVLVHSNFSKLKTGFGKNAANILKALSQDDRFEVAEAANGVPFGQDQNMPWKFYGTYPIQRTILESIANDPVRQRFATYGHYTIDEIVEDFQPDVYLGIEDSWAFHGFPERYWWKQISTVVWSTIDSLPLNDDAIELADQCDKFLVWASFAEEALKEAGVENVSTLHGGVDLYNFHPLPPATVSDLRQKLGLTDSYLVGFVFKNQLRKSVPNLLEAFKKWKSFEPAPTNAKLLLHTDWPHSSDSCWDIPKLIKDIGVDPDDVLATYRCESCGDYDIRPYGGEGIRCPYCGSETFRTKDNGFGLSEKQLNEVYNVMDVYCHPFTSGGQEIPIQEAKSAGKVTLVTSYSCGLDNCERETGGIPLRWNSYYEPSSHFIKASTDPSYMARALDRYYWMTRSARSSLQEKAIHYVNQNYSNTVIVSQLTDILSSFECKEGNLFKPEEKAQSRELSDFLGDEDINDRIAVVIPRSAGDVLIVNSLMQSFRNLYPDKKLYVITEESFFCMIDDNPFVDGLIPFHPSLDNPHFLEGRGDHKGYFGMAFFPAARTQKFETYQHNTLDTPEI